MSGELGERRMTVAERPILTDPEMHVLNLLADVASTMAQQVIGGGPTRTGDVNEMVYGIHRLQHMVMAQVAARAYPESFRLLGEDKQ